MRAAGRPGRGERAKVAARVRDLLGAPQGQPARGDAAARAPGESAWIPGMRPPPRHGEQARPRWSERLRWDPGRRGVAALGVAVIAVLAATGWWLAAGRPHELPVTSTTAGASALPISPAPASSSASRATSSLHTTAQPAALVVDVAGKVRRPGVYRLPAGARVYDALRMAGGVRPGASTLSLNLAEPLRDGEQVVVGVPGAAAPEAGATSPGAAGASSAGALVDLNTATLEQLESLPGVGPVLGQNILDWRAAHGSFTSVDQLGDVTGIGDVRLAQLRPLVSV